MTFLLLPATLLVLIVETLVIAGIVCACEAVWKRFHARG